MQTHPSFQIGILFKNIKSTNEIKLTGKKSKDNPNGNDIDNSLYTDSTYKKKFIELTPDQKVKLIAPFISNELGVNYKYVRDLMQAFFISKQQKIGDLQPIILFITGDDYGSTTMIVLNKYNKPISGFNLDGGMQPGPTEIGDSLMEYEAKSFSLINANNITTVRINHTDCTDDSLRKPTIVDSTVFLSKIDKTGHIRTRKVMSKQYTIPYINPSK